MLFGTIGGTEMLRVESIEQNVKGCQKYIRDITNIKIKNIIYFM
jgi:hypothetical protein